MDDKNRVRIECIKRPNKSVYTENYLSTLLSAERINTEHGEAFTGRPVTEIISIDNSVLKFRTEYKLGEIEARRFVQQAVEYEQKTGIHHPDKTWFLIFNSDSAESDYIEIGNITPLLVPMHQYQVVLQEETVNNYLEMVIKIVELYLLAASKHGICIDIGLSNYGVDTERCVYYLDDDFYRWNDFLDFPEFLANMIRSFDFLDQKNISDFSTKIKLLIVKYFKDEHWLTVIAEELRSVFIPENREQVRDALIKSLYGKLTFNYKPGNTSKVIALIADVHANAPALDCALDYLQGRNIKHTLVLGDIVGYGPHPEQCIETLRNNSGFSIIRGNHDHTVATGEITGGSTSLASWTLKWTIDRLDKESKQWLAGLPCYLKDKDWLAVHGSPRDKTFFNGYVYQMNYPENLDELESRGIHICFHGHTHVQKIYYRFRGIDEETVDDMKVIQNCSHALICPGSIGQPRSGYHGVELAIINLETLELEFQRLRYNIDSTINDMTSFKFPSELMDRLRNGT
ncbi:hypothetical protein MNBD_GAMMA21-506 [hydrothermal vent metagenome]|uniref:Calcineurin-like phosphoesterase domain-containing protein n=1 Tax=hydrothermal vent metagenome TaxID=652676 RepID=A0A3B1ACM0_9ZZZZ